MADTPLSGLTAASSLAADDLLYAVVGGNSRQVTYDAIRAPIYWGSTAGGTANALTVAPSPGITALAAGVRVVFKTAALPNSAASPTLAVNGTAATEIVDRFGVKLLPGQLRASTAYTATYDGTYWVLSEDVPRWLSPSDFGAVGNDTDDGDAIQACHDAWLNILGGDGGILWYPGTYTPTKPAFSDTVINAISTRTGVTSLSEVALVPGTVTIKPRYTPRGTRTAGLRTGEVAEIPYFEVAADAKSFLFHIDGLWFQGQEDYDQDPIPLQLVNANQYTINNLKISEFRNVGLDIQSINNTRSYNVQIRHCGWQPTDQASSGFVGSTATFTVNSGSADLTCSEAVFASGDVGKWLLIGGKDQPKIFAAKVLTYVDSQSVTLDRNAPEAYTATNGSFAMASGSISANDNTLTLNSACVPAGFEGVTVHVVGAGFEDTSGSGGFNASEHKLLSARITTRTSASQVDLSHNARFDVTDVPVIFMPAVYIGFTADTYQFAGHNNDFFCYGWRIERSNVHGRAAVGIVGSRLLQTYFVGGKLHGTAPNYNDIGGNAFEFFGDNCKDLIFTNVLSTWGIFHPDYAQKYFIGDRNNIVENGGSTGSSKYSTVHALWGIDPGDVDACRIVTHGGYNNTAGWVEAAGGMQHFKLDGSATADKQVQQIGGITQRETPYSFYLAPETYTPTVYFAGDDVTDNGGAVTIDTAQWKRNGAWVWVNVAITFTAKGTATGRLEVSLPTDTTTGQTIPAGNYANMTSLTGDPIPITLFSTTSGDGSGVRFRMAGAGGTGTVNVDQGNVTDTSEIAFSGWYLSND